LSSGDGSTDLLGDGTEDVSEATGSHSTENGSQTLVEEVLTESGEGTLDASEEFAEDTRDVDAGTTDHSRDATEELSESVTSELLKDGLEVADEVVEEVESSADGSNHGGEVGHSGVELTHDGCLELSHDALGDGSSLLDHGSED